MSEAQKWTLLAGGLSVVGMACGAAAALRWGLYVSFACEVFR